LNLFFEAIIVVLIFFSPVNFADLRGFWVLETAVLVAGLAAWSCPLKRFAMTDKARIRLDWRLTAEFSFSSSPVKLLEKC
jgi:hypothetical protein